MRNWKTATVILMTLALITTAACNPLGGGTQEPEEEMVEVVRGNLTLTVSGSGNLEVSNEAKLAFAISGQIETIFVEEGDEVSVGKILAELEMDSLELALAQALVGEVQARAGGAQAVVGQTQAQVAHSQAQINQDQAQAAYSQAQTARIQALLAVDIAEETLEDTEDILDRVTDFLPKNHSKVKDAEIAVERVMLQYEAAQAQLETTDAQLQAAKAQLESMDIQFKLVEDQLGAANLQYEVAQAQLGAARLAVGQAQTQLEKASIIASVNGTVALVTVDEGDTVSPAVTAFHLIDLSSMLLTVQVDEIDVADVKSGLKAIIDVDGLPNLPIEGTVSHIGALPTMEAGVIVYDVEIEFQVPEDTGLKVGMSATADIIIDKRENVLLVPARAIGQDSQGNSAVEIVIGDEQTEVRKVSTGLSDGFQTEILSGLEEGEVIIERRSRSSTSTPGFF